MEYISRNQENTVIGLVRNKSGLEDSDGILTRKNVTILQADILDRPALIAARDEVARRTGGSLDYLINNAAYISAITSGQFLDEFEDDRKTLDDEIWNSFNTNVVGVINTINIFLPLVKKSAAVKKVITLSTGLADPELIAPYGIWEAAPYSMSKAAVNIAVAKYGARYKDEGILFLAISPGVVATQAADCKESHLKLEL